ncbi:MAG: hypothetical protein KDD73_10760, partial [Anaerolineales bacterium]|nr:hypothetical protein [Anaerolineales bacterium]
WRMANGEWRMVHGKHCHFMAFQCKTMAEQRVLDTRYSMLTGAKGRLIVGILMGTPALIIAKGARVAVLG